MAKKRPKLQANYVTLMIRVPKKLRAAVKAKVKKLKSLGHKTSVNRWMIGRVKDGLRSRKSGETRKHA